MKLSFEEYISSMDKEDVPLLVLSMVLNNLKLNADIPNIELLFFHVFMSPKINQAARKEFEAVGNYIDGNIFKNHLTRIGYLSLLRTVTITGKKKHLKKILSHMNEYQPAYDMTEDLVNMVIDACQKHSYPILLGQAFRGFIDRGVPLTQESFIKFYLYLESVKGLHSDTLKFISLAHETNMEVDYKLVGPLFRKTIRAQSGDDVLLLFEQLKDHVRLNENSNEGLTESEKTLKRQKI